MSAGTGQAGPDQEAHLLKFVEDLGNRRDGRHAVHVHLSKLRPHNRQDHHLRIATTTFTALAERLESQVFVLGNADLVLICKSADRQEVGAIVDKLRYLFSGDPLTREEDGGASARFCTWFNLSEGCEAFEQAARVLYGSAKKRHEQEDLQLAKPKLKPLDPQTLGLVQKALSNADVSSLIRRQPICAIMPGGKAPQPVFTELFVSIADLRQAIAPKIDLLADHWLFQYLTQTLDKRVLSYLTKTRASSFAERISINVNMATLLSPEFSSFDAGLSKAERGTVAIELQSFDIIADMSSFRFICEYLRDRGYRLCFDGLTHLTMPYIDRQALGLDLLKVQWTPDMADFLTGAHHAEMKSLINRAGEGRVILCHCDSETAIMVGQSVGIALFQGRYVDSQLAGQTARVA